LKHKKISIIAILSIVIVLLFTVCSFAAEDDGNSVLNGIVGLITLIPRFFAIILFDGVNTILTAIANSVGNEDIEFLTTELILKNKVGITNIDFFSNGGSEVLGSMKSNIAGWYYTLRNIAIACSACTLVYMAIRMALSTTAVEKATYKTYITSWLISFILIFALNFIIVGVVELNNSIGGMFNLDTIFRQSVDINADETDEESGETAITLEEIMLEIKDDADQVWDADGSSMASAIAYCGSVFITGVFLYLYLYRMVVVAFLMIISPIVTITYAIDRGNGKSSQSLNNWLKEFIFSIIIQPIHLLLYSMLIPMALNIMSNDNVAGCIVMIFMLVFIWKAEAIVKTIFGGASSIKSGQEASDAMRPLYVQSAKYGSKAIGWGARWTAAGIAGLGSKIRTDARNRKIREANNASASNTPIGSGSSRNSGSSSAIGSRSGGSGNANVAAVGAGGSSNAHNSELIAAAAKAGAKSGADAGAKAGADAGAAAFAASQGNGGVIGASRSNVGALRNGTRARRKIKTVSSASNNSALPASKNGTNTQTPLYKRTTVREYNDRLKKRFKSPGLTEMIAKAATGKAPTVADAANVVQTTAGNIASLLSGRAEHKESNRKWKQEKKELEARIAEQKKTIDASKKDIATSKRELEKLQRDKNSTSNVSKGAIASGSKGTSSNSSKDSSKNISRDVEKILSKMRNVNNANVRDEITRVMKERNNSNNDMSAIRAEIKKATDGRSVPTSKPTSQQTTPKNVAPLNKGISGRNNLGKPKQ